MSARAVQDTSDEVSNAVLLVKLTAQGEVAWTASFGAGSGFELDLAADESAVFVAGYNYGAATLGAHSLLGSHGGFAGRFTTACAPPAPPSEKRRPSSSAGR